MFVNLQFIGTCRVRSVLTSRFILDLREAYLANSVSPSVPSRFSALQFAVGNLGAALGSQNDTTQDDMPRLTFSQPGSRDNIQISNDPYAESLIHPMIVRARSVDSGVSEQTNEVYVNYEEDGDIIVIKDGLER